MGGRRNLNIPNIFERRMEQAIASSAHVFLFDHMTLQAEVGEYFSTYYELCELSDRELIELEGADVSEQNLIQALDIKKSRAESEEAVRNEPLHSPFRVLCNLLDARRTGIICIHNAHQLSNQGVDVLSRLVGYVRRMKLRWQFMIFADAVRINDLSKLQLSIDVAYPEHILLSPTKAKEKSKTSDNRPSAWATYRSKVLALLAGTAIVLLALRYL